MERSINLLSDSLEDLSKDVDSLTNKILENVEETKKIIKELEAEETEKTRILLRTYFSHLNRALSNLRTLITKLEELRVMLRGQRFQDLLYNLEILSSRIDKLLKEIKALNDEMDIESKLMGREIKEKIDDIQVLLDHLRDFMQIYNSAIEKLTLDTIDYILDEVTNQISEITMCINSVEIYIPEEDRRLSKLLERQRKQIDKISDRAIELRKAVTDLFTPFTNLKSKINAQMDEISKYIDDINRKIIASFS